MASDLRTEIFAYNWFHRILFDAGLLSLEKDFTDAYREECLAYSECYEISDWDSLYSVILFRRWLFEKFYLKEIQTQLNEFRHSQTDFYNYVLQTCNRSDLFGNLTVFERVFATCAFICCLCLYCCDNNLSEIMKYGYICWAMYFDQFTQEFYEQGGWNRLKMVAVSYRLPMDFVDIVNLEGNSNLTLFKIRKAIIGYHRFKKIGAIDLNGCISMSWVKFYAQFINGRFDYDCNEFFEEFHSNELKNATEAENILKKFKYLCDPNGYEILKYLGQMSNTKFLESSMADLNICDKHVNPASKEELEQHTTPVNLASKYSKKLNGGEDNVLTCKEPGKAASTSLGISSKRNSLAKIERSSKDDHKKSEYFQLKSQEQGMENSTIEHLFDNMTISKCIEEKGVKKNTILTAQLPSTEKNTAKGDRDKICIDSKAEQYKRNVMKASGNTMQREQISLVEDNIEKKNDKTHTKNDIRNEQDEPRVKSTKRSTGRSGQITPIRKNAEKRNGNETLSDVKKELEKWKTAKKNTIAKEAKNTEMKNRNRIREDDVRNEQEKCKIIKLPERRTALTAQISFSKKSVKKENISKTLVDIGKEQDELLKKTCEKDSVTLIGQMSSTEKSAGEKYKKAQNRIQKEQKDGDMKNFLRMLLVLGDKQGIDYVRKTS